MNRRAEVQTKQAVLFAGWTVLFFMLSLIALPGVASETRIYADDFAVKNSYSNSSGTHPWSSPWIEAGAGDGSFLVDTEEDCVAKHCLVVGAKPPAGGFVTRSFDASSATSVILTFSYKRVREGGGAGSVRLLAAPDGIDFSPLRSYPLSVADGAFQTETVDITAFAGSASAIRFMLNGGNDESFMEIDNIRITAQMGAATTTTTTTVPPTTTTVAPTTTTVAPTTTTVPPTTTTTNAPATTGRSVTTTTPQPSPPAIAPLESPESVDQSAGDEEIPIVPISRRRALKLKDSVVLAPTSGPPPPPSEPPQARSLAPIEGLTVSFSTATETLRSRFLTSALIGMGMAAALIFGIDDRDQRAASDDQTPVLDFLRR